jgi:nucleoside-diphosphate-sugar epimerase
LNPLFQGEVRVGDLRDTKFSHDVIKDMDVVVHAAAWSSLYGHEDESHELMYKPAIALIDAARQADVKRFINISTTSAAAPEDSADANSIGIKRGFWPHMCNLIDIEEYLRQQADKSFSVINLRLGIFIGQRYGLGLLPILLPRLKTHLVPWIKGGRTTLPLIDGRDIGEAIALAVNANVPSPYEGINVIGMEKPTVREIINFLHDEFGYPRPHFSVPFALAYAFAATMEWLDKLVPFDPLVTRSIVHLLEETGATNDKAAQLLGYAPQFNWQDTIRLQLSEMRWRNEPAMRMARPTN